MMVARRAGGLRAAFFTAAALGVLAGCIDRPIAEVKPRTQSGVSVLIENNAIEDVDLLMMVDNSNSMRENQANIMAQFEPMINQLISPPIDPTTMRPRYRPVKSLHVGVVSSDLGTPGSSVPGCANSDLGDDGLLNPIRYGQALRTHEPFSAPAGFRPADCTDPNQFPSFITFDSTMAVGNPAYVTQFAHDFRCNAGLYVNGCGLEQQLEAVWRGLIWHDASDHTGNTDPNAGFLRDNALLAILMLTDEEDGSTQDCRFARGEPCTDSISVFDSSNGNWSSSNLNLRFYMYQVRGQQDPTWPLERYVDPTNPMRGFLGLKPGHPERIVFAAITGVPLEVPMAGSSIDWDQLLGAPGGSPDDFAGRNSATSINTMSREGPISMHQANADPSCSERTVPSCRREGTTYDPARPPCTTTEQYFAWPARRVVEIARRFDQSRLCNGGPCNNGIVTSICSNNYGPAMSAIVEKIQSNLRGRCLPRVLQQHCDDSGNNCFVDCIVREFVPVDQFTACDGSRGRMDVPAGVQQVQEVNGQMMHACDIAPVPTNMAGMPASGTGWYYDTTPDPTDATCRQRISFTEGAAPQGGSITRLECIQSITGVM